MQLIERLTSAIYVAPAGTIPAVPAGETADRVEINIDDIRYVWRRNADGSYRRWAGPLGWLVVEFERELLGDVQEAQANG